MSSVEQLDHAEPYKPIADSRDGAYFNSTVLEQMVYAKTISTFPLLASYNYLTEEEWLEI